MKGLDAACRLRGIRDPTNRNMDEGVPKFSVFMGKNDHVTHNCLHAVLSIDKCDNTEDFLR